MTMITSSLQTNPLFDRTSLSSRPFAPRSTSNKLPGGIDISHSATNFGHNIWQSDWQNSQEKCSDHVTKDKVLPSRSEDTRLNSAVGNKRPQPPSLALPNIKANTQFLGSGFDRRSPIGSEREAARDSEPHSARSRSQFESTSLTPTSFSNDSDFSNQQVISSLDQKRWRDPFCSAPSRERTNTWLHAPEFQPSMSVQQRDMLRYQIREPSKNGFTNAHKTQLFIDSDFDTLTSWSPYEKDGSFLDRNEFRPVLSASTGTGTGKSVNNASSFLPGNHNFQDMNSSFARLSVNRGLGHLATSSNELQASSTTKSSFSTSNLQDNQYMMPSESAGCDGRAYVQDQSLHNGDTLGIVSSQYNGFPPSYSPSSYPSSQSQQPNMQYGYQIIDFRPTETGLYAPHMLNMGLHNVAATSVNPTEYKDVDYSFNSAGGNSYGMYNSSSRGQPEPSQAIRSPLLEEFRIHGRTKKYELKDIFGHIVEFSGDQLGSRFIQHKLEVANSEEKDRVFQEIASDCRQLMTDLFGNYVIQKLFEHGNQSQKKVLAGHMKGHMMALSMQTYGCRVVQKALDHVLTDQQASLIKELDGHVLKVVDDQNGNHVIQKAIERIPGEHIQFIVDAHRGHVHALSKHAYGCRVIQRMLEHCEPRAKRAILDELHSNIGDLIQDPFGNYVVQHVIVNGEPQDRRPVIDKVQSRLLENAMHKFASNVVEKALDYAEEDQSRMMLQALTSRDVQGQSQIVKLLSHQYGNYVIQKSAAYLSGQALQALLDEMEQYLTQLRRVSTGKQTTALEASIRDARTRLHAQRHQAFLHAPTEPSRYVSVKRQVL